MKVVRSTDYVALLRINMTALSLDFVFFQNIVERRIEVKIPRLLGFGDQGSVFLHAETDRSAYCPGEEILISG